MASTTGGEGSGSPRDCAFPGLTVPADARVFAAGAYRGREADFAIDDSGLAATRLDVLVNGPGTPVLLILGAYEPTLWNIAWVSGTRILAVLVSGYYRQIPVGLPADVPVLISTWQDGAPCGSGYVASDQLDQLNPLARRLFGRPVDMVYLAEEGRVVIGAPPAADAVIIRPAEEALSAYRLPGSPLAGDAGLAEAERAGQLRPATEADAQDWVDAWKTHHPAPDRPPVAGAAANRAPRPGLYRAWVVLGPFVYPAGLYGGAAATFLVPAGVPTPTGDPGHSMIYDLGNGSCQGPIPCEGG